MAIDPYKGGKCWSCKYCEDVGYYDENLDSVYKRKCNYPGEDYLDFCSKSCWKYVWDGKDSKFNYTSRSVPSGSYYDSSSSSSSSSGSSSSSSSSSSSYSSSSSDGGNGCLTVLIIIGLVIAIGYFLFSGKYVDLGIGKKETTSQTSGQTESDGKTAVIKHTGNVNLRKKASSKSDVITSMPPDTVVQVLEEKKNWAYIDYEGTKGWCYKKYLEFQD